jgi:hypothetical protein
VQSKLAGFLHEPLVHFLAVGVGLFLFWHFMGDRRAGPSERVVITPAQVERLSREWTKTHQRPPTATELAALVEQEVDEEILYREAVALGLDRDDLVIRRRLAVKMEFVTDDVAGMATPTDEQLQAFLSQHPDKFNVESLTSFAQVCLNASERGGGASGEAVHVLALLNAKAGADWQTLGDPLPLPNEFDAGGEADVARLFGREFAKELAQLPVGRWSGPVKSGYGLHLVLVRQRTPGRAPALGEVRDAVVREWQAAQRQEFSANLRRQRRSQYAVTVQWPDWAREAASFLSGTGTATGPR